MANHSNRSHALLSASGATRWMNCTPSALAEDKIEECASEYADEGTYAHELGELKIKLALNPSNIFLKKLIADKRKNQYYSHELEDFVDSYRDYVIERFNAAKAKSPKAIILIEEKVNLGEYIPEGFGTCDIAIVYLDVVELIDLKFGMGVRVDAVNNDQLMIYGLGFVSKFDMLFNISKIKLTIFQPRLDHISDFEISHSDLVNYGVKIVKPKAEIAIKGEGDFEAGTWCKFCKLKPSCRTLRNFAFEQLRHDFKDDEVLKGELEELGKEEPEQYVLKLKELSQVYKSVNIISDWIDSVKKYMVSEALKGVKFPDLKLVRGSSKRTWKDENESISVLADLGHSEADLKNTKIKGITDIEKLVGKKEFEELGLTYKPLGSPTLVDESDKRVEIELRDSIEEAFSEPLLEE